MNFGVSPGLLTRTSAALWQLHDFWQELVKELYCDQVSKMYNKHHNVCCEERCTFALLIG